MGIRGVRVGFHRAWGKKQGILFTSAALGEPKKIWCCGLVEGKASIKPSGKGGIRAGRKVPQRRITHVDGVRRMVARKAWSGCFDH